jgi:hypothetical protein
MFSQMVIGNNDFHPEWLICFLMFLVMVLVKFRQLVGYVKFSTEGWCLAYCSAGIFCPRVVMV